MASPAYKVFVNVESVVLGSTSLVGVQEISYNKTWTEIHASADADTHETVAEGGVCSVRGTIAFTAPNMAEDIDGESGTLSFTVKSGAGLADETVTITGVTITGSGGSVRHRAASAGTVSFIARSTDGTTDPVTIA